ncbi:MAG: alternative ribosome rescue aminoacyl-tRNA hydrolase ArfB [Actinomycetota bacterium]
MARDIDTGRGVVIPAGEIAVRFSRSGGAGGQNVNKRDTQVELLFDVNASEVLQDAQRRRIKSRLRNRIDSEGVLHVVSSEERTQGRNRELALERMGELLNEALAPPPKPRRATRPSRTSVERRITDKKRRGQVKHLRRDDDEQPDFEHPDC